MTRMDHFKDWLACFWLTLIVIRIYAICNGYVELGEDVSWMAFNAFILDPIFAFILSGAGFRVRK